MSSSGITLSDVSEIKARLIDQADNPLTEEATKQWFVMPLLVALGYNPYSTDIIPEYTLDVGVKNGEKVDYAIQVQGKLVMIIECKSLNVKLSDRQISQLYRYFSVSDVNIAVLTNGNDYWFFTDTQKSNVMDLAPYYTVRLSDINDSDIARLNHYSKDSILSLDVQSFVRRERLMMICRDLAEGLRCGRVPDWIIEGVAERSGGVAPDDMLVVDCLKSEIMRVFGDKAKMPIEDKEPAQQFESMDKPKKSNIKLKYEYVFNDYSDGDWTFHKLGYAVVFGRKIETSNMRSILLEVISFLLDNGYVSASTLLTDDRFKGTLKIVQGVNVDTKRFTCLNKHNLSVLTNLSGAYIVKFIECVLAVANQPADSVKFSFKS